MSSSNCSEEKVTALKKDLERAMRNEDDMNSAKTRELLLQLKCISMKLNVLEKTRVGMTINNLRKSTSDKDISQLCKVSEEGCHGKFLSSKNKLALSALSFAINQRGFLYFRN